MDDGDGGSLSGVLDGFDLTALISDDALTRLQSFLDDNDGTDVWTRLSSGHLPPAALASSLSAAMDSPVPRTSLLASRAYLSALLSTSAPVYTLFTPLSFLSLLRSIRRALKSQPPGSEPSSTATSSSQEASHQMGRKRKKRRAVRWNGPLSHCDLESAENGIMDVESLLLEVLRLLELVLGRVSLDVFPDGVQSLVEAVTGILGGSSGEHRLFSGICFRILYSVASMTQHDDQTLSVMEVMRSLAPMLFLPMKSPIRTSALEFMINQLVPASKESDAMTKAIAYFPRYLALKAPEKAERRASAVDAIVEMTKVMEPKYQVAFLEYVYKMNHGKPQLRLLAVDLISSLLIALPDPLGEDELDDHDVPNWGVRWGVQFLQALVERCSDALAGIRARALTNVAHTLELLSGDAKNRVLLQNLIASKYGGFNYLSRKRCLDEKAAVRKAALLLITKSMLVVQNMDDILIETVGRACSDPMVSIRKAAVTALSEAYRNFKESRIIMEWLLAVPRLIMDHETSVQEECENLFLELVLNWISTVGKAHLSTDVPNLESVLPEGILALLKGLCHNEVVPCVKKICTILGKKKKLKPIIASSLQNIIATSESIWLNNSMPIEMWMAPTGTWFLLSEVSPFIPKAIDWKFLHHHWKLLDNGSSSDMRRGIDATDPISVAWAEDRVSLLRTISNVSLELPPEPAAELAHNLLTHVQDFSMHLTEVDAHVKALKTLCMRKAVNHHDGDSLILKWVRQVTSKALKILKSYLAEVSENIKNANFLTPQSGAKQRRLKPKSVSEAVIAVFTIGSLVLVCPSIDVKDIIPLLHTIMASPSRNWKQKGVSQLTVQIKDIDPSLYVQSWVTMGKICLIDDKLAKRYIPLFVQELERSDSAAIRNNIMIVMTDFCVRYTALVDSYIPKITNSLRDPCEVVRRQTFILLSRLLQRDYVKWKGVLFLRFLVTLVDDSEKVRHLADYLFGNILKVKAPLLAYNSFVEAIFVLNDCQPHAGHFDSFGSPKTSGQNFSIRGSDDKPRAQRMHIYVSLLRQMASEQLLATSAKLCAEILAAAADGLLNIDHGSGKCVLQDALQILACKEMRLQPGHGTDSAEEEDEGGAAGIHQRRGRAVTQASKKNLIQHAVPIFIELKRLLESKNSPLTGCLMECLRVLLKDFKNEIEDILVADKQLQRELIYDMQRYEAARTKHKVAEAVAQVQQHSEGFRSPAACDGGVFARVADKLGPSEKVASAVADAAAKATVRSVLKEVNRDAPTPPLGAMSLPKVKSGIGEGGRENQRKEVLESLRKRQSFDSDEENL